MKVGLERQRTRDILPELFIVLCREVFQQGREFVFSRSRREKVGGLTMCFPGKREEMYALARYEHDTFSWVLTGEG